MKRYSFGLSNYSAFASAFLISGNALAVVEYTDIEPDIVLDSDFESGGVDMDNNGIIDFAFLNFSYPWYSPGYSFIERIFVGPYGTPLNNVAALEIGLQYFPYALSYGDVIDSGFAFQNYGFQQMAWRKFLSIETGSGDTLFFTGYGGAWYPEMLDHYLGVHFIDENAEYHYGWIRCDVKDEGRTLVIKDYAYEKFIDHEIIAGDTVGYQPFGYDSINIHTGTEIENVLTGANIYSFENKIYIQLPILYSNAKVRVYDLTGKVIYSSSLQNLFSEINLNNSKGNYLVEINTDEGKLTKKIYLN